MKKTIISLSLASTLLISTVACAAETQNIDDKNIDNEQTVISEEPQEEQSQYITHKGKITETNKEDGSLMITVDEREMLAEGDKPVTRGAIQFNISQETVLLSDKTQNSIEGDKLVKGAVVEVSYGKDAPMTKSLPPMTNADVVVLREATDEKAELGIKVDKFDKDNISADNSLKFNITEDTVIVDKNGEKLSEKDIYDKDLIVFYGPATTMSIPAQSNAVKIIALYEQDKPEVPGEDKVVKTLDKIIYNGKTIQLQTKLYKSGDRVMMPVREIAENLGYKVSWNNTARQAEFAKGSNFLTASADKDMYGFAKMIVKLGMAPEIKDGTMSVPVSFIEEVMQLEMEITEEGTISIK